MRKYNRQQMMLIAMLGFAMLASHANALSKKQSKTTSKSEAYQQAQQQNSIVTHGNKFKIKPKVKQLNPLPYLVRPNLNGNFKHQQQYQAAQNPLKTRTKTITSQLRRKSSSR